MNWLPVVAVTFGVIASIVLFLVGYACGYADGRRSRRAKGITLYP